MSTGFRQSLSGLHTWSGLVFGWLLMVIFVAGTICVFSAPISQWMRGGPPASQGTLSTAQSEQALGFALRYLQREAGDVAEWSIVLAPARVEVEWHDADDVEHERQLDPSSGREIPAEARHKPRETAGGWHFVGFHYSLHAGMGGIVLVGVVSIATLVVLVSGIIVHKRIFKDFFTLRLGKGQRSWLDGHNVASVLSLPFQLMIVYTGLVIFQNVWMPGSILYHYGMPGGLGAELQLSSPYWDAERAEAQRQQGLPQAQPAAGLAPDALLPLVAQAQARSGQPLAWMTRQADDDGGYRLWLGMAAAEAQTLPRPRAATFQIVGEPPHLREEARYPRTEAEHTRGVLINLHEARFGGWTASWLWFLCGVVGCVMIASGLVLFTVKRRQRSGNEFGRATPQMYRLIEALNVACVAGICLASIAYLWGNRLLPLDLPERPETEIRVFLLVWAATLLHALSRPGRRAWVEQFGLAALLCLTLPLLNLATTGDWFGRYAGQGRWQMFAVELVSLVVGTLLAAMTLRMARKAT
ncbi:MULTISPECIES: PepSY-associated TM helix domain-containing protein [unclassified Pseudomonas]|uniref:PepSY-associated TM helix domain-containing protein n=1 Tax=unclassified Pseudomonas TaxID=196821 RepID=UPI0024471F68|nr:MULTISPECIES: PepSY-associated TM helix domain-containing protein [unclassified Pseudomonas]MDH0893596.1 PepSY domain-containing protein [Pseudomonas sp. GD03875]MDH1065753.1 PepSY domain-containing protein [Pseudomonas sp. GD03985]